MSYKLTLKIMKQRRDKRLTRGVYRRNVKGRACFCAIGAVLPATRGFGIDGICEIWQKGRVREEAAALLLSPGQALALQIENDGYRDTPAKRYTRVVAWLEKQVAKEKHNDP